MTSHVDEIESHTQKDENLDSGAPSSGHSDTGTSTPCDQPPEKCTSICSSASIVPTPSVRNSSENLNLTPTKRNYRFGWHWEVWAALLGLTSTILIIAILISMNEKPLRNWKTAIVQPNSLIAIFSTIAKTALLVSIAESLGQLKWIYFENPRQLNHFQIFDEASRGPWGATKLIFYTKGTARLGALGAIAVILMLAFEPFAQQVIQYVNRYSELTSSNGTVGISYAWTDINLNQSAENSSLASYKSLYTPLVTDITSALLEQTIDIAPNTYCPSSACDLKSYDSLAVCSRCDIETLSSNYSNSCKYLFREESPRRTSSEYLDRQQFIELLEAKRASNTSKGQAIVMCNKKISENRYLGIQAFWNTSTTNVWFTAADPDKIVYGDAGWEVNMQKEDHTSDHFRFCIYDDWNDDPAKYKADPRVPEGFARHRRRSFFTTDPQSTTMISNAYCFTLNINPSLWLIPGRFGEINGTITHCRLDFCANQYNRLEIRNGNKKIGSIDQIPLTVSNSTDNDTYSFVTPKLPDRTFTIGKQARDSLVYMFHSIAERKNKDRYQFDFMIRPQNWPALFNQLAAALTNVIQSPVNPRAENLKVVAYGMETYVTVRWPWMTLPLALVFMSVLFLCLTIWTSRKRRYLFKTSLLPVFSHGGEGWSEMLQDSGRSADDPLTYRDLERGAKGNFAAFKEDSQGRYRVERQLS